MDPTDESAIGGLHPTDFFDVSGDTWVPKVVFTGANSQLRPGAVGIV